jgi:hypothetical protein
VEPAASAVADPPDGQRPASFWIEAAVYSAPMFLIARSADFRASSSEAQSSGVTMLRMTLPELDRPLGVTLARQTPGWRW